jgi:KDO2-lipid IV(A) lauroyltransferase
MRTMPEQYFWVHRRFKTRPRGEAPVYADQRRR